MQQLPRGYYAVASDFENASKDTFTYKGVTYAVTEGVNLFARVHDADKAAIEIPETVLDGMEYTSFSAPVILFSAGKHKIDGYTVGGDRYLLGEGACVDPNVWQEDRFACPAFNEARAEEGESVLFGSYYGGNLYITKPVCHTVVIDGFTMDNARIGAWVMAPASCDITVRNIVHKSPCGHLIYDFSDKGSNGEVLFENIRIKDFDDLGYAGICMLLSAPRATLSHICYDTTGQLFGFTDMTRRYANYNDNVDVAEYLVKDCYFGNMDGENGIATGAKDAKGRGYSLTFDGCTFVNASRANEGVIQPHVANAKCAVTVRDCAFRDDRGNEGAAIVVKGNANAVTIENSTFEGFADRIAQAPSVSRRAPAKIANRRMSWTTKTEDAHRVIGTDAADFTALDVRYEGKKAYYGDQHAHTKCGGTSDGTYPMDKWVARLDELGVDFAYIVDHRQMRGFFLPEWDTDRFVYGTEPGGAISDLKAVRRGPGTNGFHYNMLFRDKYDLALVLANFPEYKFKGDRLTGKFGYPSFTRERFDELAAYIHSIGGMLVHPHPTAIMSSTDPTDYVFGEYTFFETLYNTYAAHDSFRNYDMWVRILDTGAHVYTSGGTDTHGEPRNTVVSTLYCAERTGTAAFDCMKSGDFTVGMFGMKLCIDGKPMGSRLAYREGMKLTLRVDDIFKPTHEANTVYELRVYTDKGLAYASTFNGEEPQALALEVQKRRYYRAEVFDLTHGYRVAVSNPIWLDLESE